jgi:ATP-dependent exoDNAse (exonuclease V) beta subunit
VTVQTIHTAKGLEYPIVILANMNDGSFPPRSSGSSVIQYQDPVGLRQRKIYSEERTYPHIYDNWRSDVLRRCLPQEYDEERRLLYVAVTRAENHVVFAAGAEPNTFFEELPADTKAIDPSVEPLNREEFTDAELPFTVTTPQGPISQTPHSLMDETVFEEIGARMEATLETEPETRGVDFGSRVHDFAEAYVLGEEVTPSNPHERRIVDFVDDLPGELHVEEPVTLPIEVDGHRVTISGIVDLVHVTADQVDIIDYKTDSTRHAQPEYRKQISVYYHVLSEWFKGKNITVNLFYTNDGSWEQVDPLPLGGLKELVRRSSSKLDD